jgi:hypothetical protein
MKIEFKKCKGRLVHSSYVCGELIYEHSNQKLRIYDKVTLELKNEVKIAGFYNEIVVSDDNRYVILQNLFQKSFKIYDNETMITHTFRNKGFTNLSNSVFEKNNKFIIAKYRNYSLDCRFIVRIEVETGKVTDEIKFTDNKQFKIFKNKQTGKIYALIEDVDSNDKNENWIYEIEQFKLNKLYKLDTRQPIKEIICYDDGYYIITYGGYVSKLSYEGETLLESFSILGALYRICRLDYCNEQFITSVCEAKSQDVIFVSTEWRFYVFNLI